MNSPRRWQRPSRPHEDARKLLRLVLPIAASLLVFFPCSVLGLSVSPPSPSAAATSSATSAVLPWRLQTAVATLEGIQRFSSTPADSANRSEKKVWPGSASGVGGIWDNALLGVALVKASRHLRSLGSSVDGDDDDHSKARAEKYRSWARTIATNIYEKHYEEGEGFGCPSLGGASESVNDVKGWNFPEFAIADEGRGRHRCAPNAAAVLFLSYLSEDHPDDDELDRMITDCGDVFLDRFFSRRTGRFQSLPADASAPSERWTASDQALGMMASLRLARRHATGGEGGRRRYAEIRAMASCAAESLLDDFGYGAYATEGLVPPVNSVFGESPSVGDGMADMVEYRNSRDDALASFAILASRACSGAESPVGLCKFLARDYGVVYNAEDGRNGRQTEWNGGRTLLLAHEIQDNRHLNGAGPNAYSSTQAVWDAVLRAGAANMDAEGNDGDEQITDGGILRGFDEFTDGLRRFREGSSVSIEGDHRTGDGDFGASGGLRECDVALSTVGTAYPQVRLGPNAELAAWLLIDPDDFLLRRW